MEVNELKEKIREVYKLINYQNAEFEWNDQLKQARKILNVIQSKLHQPTVISSVYKHKNEVVRQGDGFIYVTCKDCGEEL